MRAASLLTVAALAVALGACALIVGFPDLPNLPDASIEGGGPDAAPDTGPIDPCQQPNVPPRPPPNTSSSGDSVVFTAALYNVMQGSSDGGPYYGFNLDKTCTCPQPESCVHSGAPRTEACDDPGGIDNYARRIFEAMNLNTIMLNQALQHGLSGGLITISDYNGQADDAVVTVTVYGALGYEGWPNTPTWDGGDHWMVDQVSANGQYSTPNAYVTGYQLVANPLNFDIIVDSAYGSQVTIELLSGIIVADLQMNGASLVKMTGMLGGRWDPARFLQSLQTVQYPIDSGSYLCGDAGAYQLIKSIICANTDVNTDPQNDNTSNATCNAVSMGLGFVALPAIVGMAGGGSAVWPCGVGWTDNCN